MAVWIDIKDIKTDILYGLFVGRAWRHRVTEETGKDWDLHFYNSDKSRRRGIIYQKREYPGADFLTFELKTIDLIQKAKTSTIIPKEIHIQDELLSSMRPWIKG